MYCHFIKLYKKNNTFYYGSFTQFRLCSPTFASIQTEKCDRPLSIKQLLLYKYFPACVCCVCFDSFSRGILRDGFVQFYSLCCIIFILQIVSVIEQKNLPNDIFGKNYITNEDDNNLTVLSTSLILLIFMSDILFLFLSNEGCLTFISHHV